MSEESRISSLERQMAANDGSGCFNAIQLTIVVAMLSWIAYSEITKLHVWRDNVNARLLMLERHNAQQKPNQQAPSP